MSTPPSSKRRLNTNTPARRNDIASERPCGPWRPAPQRSSWPRSTSAPDHALVATSPSNDLEITGTRSGAGGCCGSINQTELNCMNLKFLATAAALAAFAATGAQAQSTATHGQRMAPNSMRGSAGVSGSVQGKQVQPRGTASGTVGAATRRSGVNAGTSGSVQTPAAGVSGGARAGGSMR